VGGREQYWEKSMYQRRRQYRGMKRELQSEELYDLCMVTNIMRLMMSRRFRLGEM
jgi:hypothetical protein